MLRIVCLCAISALLGCAERSLPFASSSFDLAVADSAAPPDLGMSDMRPSAPPAPDLALPSPPSCLGLAATCGAQHDESCCTSPLVPGGSYFRDYDVAGDGMFADMTHPATVSDFRLDKFEITVGRFRAFVNAGQGTQANPPAAGVGAVPGTPTSGWDPSRNASLAVDRDQLITLLDFDPGSSLQSWTDVPGANEDLPIIYLDWLEAFAFCAWDGGYLPSAAQWNYAAAGGSEQRAYPWSSPPASTLIDRSHSAWGAAVVQPVGATPLGDGRWGQSDLAGNLFELMHDFTDSETYIDPCFNCVSTTGTFGAAIRAGSFDAQGAWYERTAYHDAVGYNERDVSVGARCARAK